MKKIKTFISNYYIVIAFFLLSFYFLYHIFYSKRGYIHLEYIQNEIIKATAVNNEVLAYKQELNHKVNLLSGEAIDEDFLDEMIRVNLNMAEKNEYLVVQ